MKPQTLIYFSVIIIIFYIMHPFKMFDDVVVNQIFDRISALLTLVNTWVLCLPRCQKHNFFYCQVLKAFLLFSYMQWCSIVVSIHQACQPWLVYLHKLGPFYQSYTYQVVLLKIAIQPYSSDQRIFFYSIPKLFTVCYIFTFYFTFFFTSYFSYARVLTEDPF